MSGRFAQHYTWAELHTFFGLFGDPSTPRHLPARYNIAPTTFIDVVTSRIRGREIVGREMVPMRWGLIPDWWKKSRKEVTATFNAHAETLSERPMFRGAFKYRRCIIPASGFYEWSDAKNAKQPHLFTAADGSPVLAFAGLWDRWIDPDNFDEVISATIIVSGANSHRSRRPVLLEPQDFDGWLAGSAGSEVLNSPQRVNSGSIWSHHVSTDLARVTAIRRSSNPLSGSDQQNPASSARDAYDQEEGDDAVVPNLRAG